ncbi:hypothetical protein OAA90_06590, partial [Salibacteraceae bacterium]|nr:hypothetical protein [Salibacteraceae bacterium]
KKSNTQKMENKNVIVLKTDIQSEQMLRLISPLFDAHSAILKWSVDLEDCDKVLRVEGLKTISADGLAKSLQIEGIAAEELAD